MIGLTNRFFYLIAILDPLLRRNRYVLIRSLPSIRICSICGTARNTDYSEPVCTLQDGAEPRLILACVQEYLSSIYVSQKELLRTYAENIILNSRR